MRKNRMCNGFTFIRNLIAITLVIGVLMPMNLAVAGDDCEPEWSALGGGMNDTVRAVTVYNGDLIAGGNFTSASGQTVNYIARWDGSEWLPFTSGGQIGMNDSVSALTVWNGDLIAGGYFTSAAGHTVNRIARWDGSEWHPFTSGGQIGMDFSVHALTMWNGDLIAGGQFIMAGGQTVNRIARWDGSAWHPFSFGVHHNASSWSIVWTLAVWNGDLIAGGNFNVAGGQTVNYLARWDGSEWHPFTAGGQTGVGGQWPSVLALTEFNGDLIAGGRFTTAGGVEVNGIAKWDGEEWSALGTGISGGLNPVVRALTVFDDGSGGGPALYAGGEFTTAGSVPANHIAKWDGESWSPLGTGVVGGSIPGVTALTVFNDGSGNGPALYAGGFFTTAGGVTANRIAAWGGCGEPGGPDPVLVDHGSGPSQTVITPGSTFQIHYTVSNPSSDPVDLFLGATLERQLTGEMIESPSCEGCRSSAVVTVPAMADAAVFTRCFQVPHSADAGIYELTLAIWPPDGPNCGPVPGTDSYDIAQYQLNIFSLQLPPGGDMGQGTQVTDAIQFDFELPVFTSGKRNLVFITHGWQPFWTGDPNETLGALRDEIEAKVDANPDLNLEDWDIIFYSWIEDAAQCSISPPGQLFSPLQCAMMAQYAAYYGNGWGLGQELASYDYEYIHLIAHSAGSALITSMTESYRLYSGNEETLILNTFLDPFVTGFHSIYGNGATWAQSYYARDCWTGYHTNGGIEQAFEFNVTNLDPVIALQCSSTYPWHPACYPLQLFLVGFLDNGPTACLSSHNYPIQFYRDTVEIGNSWPDNWQQTEGYGHPLSLEGGNYFLDGSGNAVWDADWLINSLPLENCYVLDPGSHPVGTIPCLTQWNFEVSPIDFDDLFPIVGGECQNPYIDQGTLIMGCEGGGLVAGNGGDCNPYWDGTIGQPGVDGTSEAGVSSLVVFDDGNGPKLYVGGRFLNAGGMPANHIASWDGQEWSTFGSGFAGTIDPVVMDLAVFDDGSGPALYVAGRFTTVDGVPAQNIARWDGSSWSHVGSGVTGFNPDSTFVNALMVFDDGNGPKLYIGGQFSAAGSTAASNVAMWDGTSWSSVGGGTNGSVSSFEAFDDGTGAALYVGGGFWSAGGVEVNYIAKWDGNEWSSLGDGVDHSQFPSVNSLRVYDDGSGTALYAGGRFTSAGGVEANFIAVWDGSEWSPLGDGMDGEWGIGTVTALSVFDAGSGPSLYAGGVFTTAGDVVANGVAKWNGVEWTELDSGFSAPDWSQVSAFAQYDVGIEPSLYIGGVFTAAGDVPASHIATWIGCAGGPKPSDPVTSWANFTIEHDSDFDLVQVDIEFFGQQEHAGVVTAYIDGNKVLNIDGRFAPAGANTYSFGVPSSAIDNDSFILSFKLTSFTNFETSVEISNVQLVTITQQNPAIPGDLNGDGVVNVSDLLILLGAWGVCPDPADCPADLNDDGVVNVSDLLILLANWG